MNYIVFLGRLFYSLIFITSSLAHFTAPVIAYGAAQGVPMPSVLVPLSGVIALAGGLSILLGYKARLGGWLLVIFLVPCTLIMHKFWGLSDPMAASLQQAMFMKNLSMLGAALLITYFGAGPVSMDNRKKR